jgi:hypothetical protein
MVNVTTSFCYAACRIFYCYAECHICHCYTEIHIVLTVMQGIAFFKCYTERRILLFLC